MRALMQMASPPPTPVMGRASSATLSRPCSLPGAASWAVWRWRCRATLRWSCPTPTPLFWCDERGASERRKVEVDY